MLKPSARPFFPSFHFFFYFIQTLPKMATDTCAMVLDAKSTIDFRLDRDADGPLPRPTKYDLDKYFKETSFLICEKGGFSSGGGPNVDTLYTEGMIRCEDYKYNCMQEIPFPTSIPVKNDDENLKQAARILELVRQNCTARAYNLREDPWILLRFGRPRHRQLATILMIDITDDADSKEVKEIIELAKKRKRTQTDDRQLRRREPHSKKSKNDELRHHPVYVNSGNREILKSLGVGLSSEEDTKANCVLELPEGWTAERRLQWDGSESSVLVVKDKSGAFVCEIVNNLIRNDVVIL